MLFSIIDRNSIRLDLVWTKAHWSPDIQHLYDPHPIDVIGNYIADSLAELAASRCQVLHQDACDLLCYYSLVRKIQARALAILSAVIPSQTVVPKPKSSSGPRAQRQLTLGASVLTTNHVFSVLGPGAWCHRCAQRAPVGTVQLRAWLSTPCIPDKSFALSYFSGKTRPAPLPTGKTVQVGWQTLHSSHKLMVYRGLIFCGVCGYYASKRALRLVGECTERGVNARRRALHLRQGILPSGVGSWPNELAPGHLSHHSLSMERPAG